MKIGELAARTGAAVGTIRFYESRGILDKADAQRRLIPVCIN